MTKRYLLCAACALVLIGLIGVLPAAAEEYGPTGKWGSYGTGDGQFWAPFDAAVDADGHVYVTDTGNHRVQKFTSDGTFIMTWGSFGAGDGQFSTPRGIAVDSSGNVYVADEGNNRIQIFTSTGTFVAKWGQYLISSPTRCGRLSG